MNDPRKLTTRQQSAEDLLQRQAGRQTARDFNSAEEMLREDARQTAVPSSIAARLAQSLKAQAKPGSGRPWWKRLLGS